MGLSGWRLGHLRVAERGLRAGAQPYLGGHGLGDMIVDGVSRRDVVRPLSLSGPDNAPGAVRLAFWGSWPRLLIEVRAVRAGT
jgi:hypothetical protein